MKYLKLYVRVLSAASRSNRFRSGDYKIIQTGQDTRTTPFELSISTGFAATYYTAGKTAVQVL